MIAYQGKNRIWIKAIAMSVVCLFLVNDIALAYPVDTNPSKTSLQVQSKFAPIANSELNQEALIELPLKYLISATDPDHFKLDVKIPAPNGDLIIIRFSQRHGEDDASIVPCEIFTKGGRPIWQCEAVIKNDRSFSLRRASASQDDQKTTTEIRHSGEADSKKSNSQRVLKEQISIVAKSLAEQNANIILEKNNITDCWIMRRGPIDLELDERICAMLGSSLAKEGKASALITLRVHDSQRIRNALESILISSTDMRSAFAHEGIRCAYEYKRILLVAPFGDEQGQQLKYATPHKGVELIAHRLRTETDDVDAVVYNPNLTSREELYSYARANRFDVIGFSVLQNVLPANLEIMGRLSVESPASVFIAGGSELRHFPAKEIFDSWPVDIIGYDDGTSLVQVAKVLNKNDDKKALAGKLAPIHNIAYSTSSGVPEKTESEKIEISHYSDIVQDIPYAKPDVVHGKQYDGSSDTAKSPVYWNVIGRRPTRIYFGNRCKGHCIFCATRRNTVEDLSPEETLKIIKEAPPGDDSVHFESADLFNDPSGIMRVFKAIKQDQNVRKIPKLAVARADGVRDGEIVRQAAEAGFKIIAYGIESFDDNVLRNIGKGTTMQENVNALQETIKAGIKPGINLIFYTPWDTIESELKTVRSALYFLERGAYANVVPFINAGFGRPVSKHQEIMEYETVEYPGMKKPFIYPRRAKILDAGLAAIAEKAMKRLQALEAKDDHPQWFKASVSRYSLNIFKSFLLTLKESAKDAPSDIDELLARVDAEIARVYTMEASSMMVADDPMAPGLVTDRSDIFCGVVMQAMLKAEDGRDIMLQFTDPYPPIPKGQHLPSSMVYNINVMKPDGGTDYKGFVIIDIGPGDKVVSARIDTGMRHADVVIARAVRNFLERASEDPLSVLYNSQADYRDIPKDYSAQLLFANRSYRGPRAYGGKSQTGGLIMQAAATYAEGLDSIGARVANILPEKLRSQDVDARLRMTVHRPKSFEDARQRIGPHLAISDMDLTQFPSDEAAPAVIRDLADKALKYKTAAISIYPRHLEYLPVKELRAAGIHIGVVAAFPGGLGNADIPKELEIVEQAVRNGADEVDFVIDVDSIKKGMGVEDYELAEKSLRAFSDGIERIRLRTGVGVRLKAILETDALESEGLVRIASRLALRYADMIKMVSGFPVSAAGGRRGRANLHTARIMLEEIARHYNIYGNLKGMKITGGISTWDDPTQPDRSAKSYYQLVFDVLGEHLGGHYLFEQDLFRVGGYGGLDAFLGAVTPDDCPVPSHEIYFKQSDYRYLDIPMSEDEASLHLGDYLGQKFSPGLLKAIGSGSDRIELHRGSISATRAYLHNLVLRGYDISELPDARSPQKFYRVSKDGMTVYIIANLIGDARELFVLQALSRYYRYPDERISIRVFEEGDFKAIFAKTIGKYSGKLAQAVILHEVDNYLSVVTADRSLNLKLVERLKGDYVDAAIVRKDNGDLALIFEMQYANGSHIANVVNYFSSEVADGGLGIKDVTLHGACGGIGDGIAVNDLILYSDIYWDGKKLENIPHNDIDSERLAYLLPKGITAHHAPIYDIPTVLNGSRPIVRSMAGRGDGAIELEAAHAAMEAAKHTGVKFRAFYEVHDKPAVTAEGKKDALGKAVPGYRDPAIRHATWRSLARYLYRNGKIAGKKIYQGAPEALMSSAQWEALERIMAYKGSARTPDTESALETIDRVLFKKKKDRLVFLGGQDGRAFYESIVGKFKGQAYYWDALQHITYIKKGNVLGYSMIHHVPNDRLYPDMRGSHKAFVFIDNIHLILNDPALRKEFEAVLREGLIPVVGYMPARYYPSIERGYCDDEQERAWFGRFAFEVTREDRVAMKDKKIIVLGASGLVGRRVMDELRSSGFTKVVGVSRNGDYLRGIIAADLASKDVLKEMVGGADYVINCAVSLDFKGMESGGRPRDEARKVNVLIPEVVSELYREGTFRGKVVHLSSYYVFGHNDKPVSSFDPTGPLQEYGREKLEAERVVLDIPGSTVVRLGPLIGYDERARQKDFYGKVIQQLEDLRAGKKVEPIDAPTYPSSPILSAHAAALSVVSLLEYGFAGIAQLSGDEQLDAVEQARRIERIYNKIYKTKLKTVVHPVKKGREGSLTPDVRMSSMTTPSLDLAIEEMIKERVSDAATKKRDRLNGRLRELIGSRPVTITIDGHSGTGKSSAANIIAERLGLARFSNGNVFRLATWYALRNGIVPSGHMTDDEVSRLANLLETLDPEKFKAVTTSSERKYFYDGEDITKDFMGREASNLGPFIARNQKCRAILTGFARSIIAKMRKEGKGVILEGRVTGIELAPDAEAKVFLTASATERAIRRAGQFVEIYGSIRRAYRAIFETTAPRGMKAPELFKKMINRVKRELVLRDRTDEERETMPFRPAPDAVVVDTSSSPDPQAGADRVIEALISIVSKETSNTEAHRLADAVITSDAQGVAEVKKPSPADVVQLDADEGIMVIKPGGTFNHAFIYDIMQRAMKRGYQIEGVSVFAGEEIRQRDLFSKEHPFGFLVAKHGEATFSSEDRRRMIAIYDTPEFERIFGARFQDARIIAAYELIEKYGLTEGDVSALWMKGYADEQRFMKGAVGGINKIGPRKYLLAVSDPRIEGGKPFIMANGVFIQMKAEVETPEGRSIVLLLRRSGDASATWKEMREMMLGDKSPAQCPVGSIRKDAIEGRMNITEPVPFWKNIVHMSSGPFESLLEEMVWFGLESEATAFGRLLLANGYSSEEIEFFTRDPEIAVNGVKKPLFDWTEKMQLQEALAFIGKTFPTFYAKAALPTITFSDYHKYKEAHDKGALSVASNIVDASRIRPTSAHVLDCPSKGSPEAGQYAQAGKSVIRNGKFAQAYVVGGTGGRWFGYDVPEHLRIRFLADAYEMEGKMRSFAEIKLANNRWTAQEARGNIPVWIMTGQSSDSTIRGFFGAHDNFGLRKEDVHFYTQGNVPRMNPTRKDLEAAFPDKPSEWIDARIAENGGEADIFRQPDGSPGVKPMGHFDSIASLFVNRELLRMLDGGVEYLQFADNNLGTIIDPVILGMLARSKKDLIHVLAVKNRIFEIECEGLDKKAVVVVREGKIVYSSLPDNLNAVVENGEVVKIARKLTGAEVKAKIKGALEKGGTLVDIDGKPQILEGFRFPKEYPQETIPYFSTACQIVKAKALLKLFDVTLDEYRKASTETLLEKASRVGNRLNTYVEIKEVIDSVTGKTRLAAQFSRLGGDLTSLLPTEYVLVDRDGQRTDSGFLPFKDKKDLQINAHASHRILSGRTAFREATASDVLPDIRRPEGVAKKLAEGVVSKALTRRVVLAFDQGMGGLQAARILSVFGELEDLKKDPRFEKLLKNLIIVKADPSHMSEKLGQHISDGAEIFLFARSSERAAFSGIENMVRPSYIEESGFPENAYHPLPEIVAITLAHAIDPASVNKASSALARINILSMEEKDRALVFTLLPNAEQLDAGELVRRYAIIKELLRSA